MATAGVTIGQLVRATFSGLTNGNGTTQTVRLPAHVGSLRLGNGTGDLQVNRLGYQLLSFTGTTGQTIDLTAFADAVRGTLAFSRIKVLVLYPRSTTYTQYVRLGNAASDVWTPFSADTATVDVFGSGPLLLTHPGAGWVVDASNKNLLLTPSATQTADLFVAGLS